MSLDSPGLLGGPEATPGGVSAASSTAGLSLDQRNRRREGMRVESVDSGSISAV